MYIYQNNILNQSSLDHPECWRKYSEQSNIGNDQKTLMSVFAEFLNDIYRFLC